MVTSDRGSPQSVVVALIQLADRSPRIAGNSLAERAVLAAQRAGLRPIFLAGTRDQVEGALQGFSAAAVHGAERWADSQAARALSNGAHVMVIGPDVLVEPKALVSLAQAALAAPGARPLLVSDDEGPLLAFVPATASRSLLGLQSPLAQAAARRPSEFADSEMTSSHPPLSDAYARRVHAGADVWAVAREYTRHLNGRESYFTRHIRRFSVPLSVQLAGVHASPTAVTTAGLVLAFAAAAGLAQGSYVAGLLGAGLYYASMVLDCSDGEVARLTFRDSPFGAWLETAVDYFTYVLIFAALAVRGPGGVGTDTTFHVALWLAALGSAVVVVVASYLRHRVARRDPGEFDAASAQALKHSSGFHRFARWGRQWIKRSTIAHLLVALAAVGQLPVLVYLWAFGATVAAIVIVGVQSFVVRRVHVEPIGVPRV